MRLFDWLTWRTRRDRDLQEEIAAHLTMATGDRIAGGEDPQDAHFAARKEFGNVTLMREATRLTWGGLWLERINDIVRDAAYALRLLLRSRGYALTVIAVVAVGIACNVIVFSLYKALALTPLAGVPDSGSLHYVGARTVGGGPVLLSYPEYNDIRDQAFPTLAGSTIQQVILGQGARGQRVIAEMVTGNFFSTLNVSAQHGRILLPSDDVAPGKHPVAVLSDTFWRTSFGADPGVVGRAIRVNGQPLTITGVAAREFRGSIVGLSIDIFLPIKMYTQVIQNDTLLFRNNQMVMALMQLPTRASRDQARTKAAIVSSALAEAHAIDHLSERAIVVPISEWPFGAQSFLLPAVGLMSAMSGLLLVVVCANVAGLVLVRSMARRGEIAARLALGASRFRIVRQLMIESFVLAIPAAGVGLLLPRVAEPFISAAMPNVVVPLFFNVEPDRFVIGFTLIVAWLSALISGLAPAIQLSRMDLASVLKDDLSPLGPSRGSLRTTLVVMQIAMSLILLIGTGLVLRSLDSITRADPGFAAAQVTWATFDVRAGGVSAEGGRQFYRQLLEVVAADDRIDSASLAAYLPLTMIDWQSWNAKPEGYASRRDENLTAAVNVVGPEYFQTLRIPLLAGREFAIRDEESAPRVAVINETFARRFWGGPSNAIGKRFEGGGQWRTVVGVARDMKYARLDETPRPYVYVPFGQSYDASMTLEVRAGGPSGEVLERIRAHAASINPDMPIVDSGLLVDQIRSAISILETVARVLGMIGVLTIGLVALGIYGLVAYTVKQSAHEIGIRTALGAGPGDITRRFLSSGARLGIVGVVLGTIGALAVTRLMAQLLYGVSATDPLSFVTASVLVLSVALGASFIPAWRASRGSPLRALRHQ